MFFNILAAYDPPSNIDGTNRRKQCLLIHFFANNKDSVSVDRYSLTAVQCCFNVPSFQAQYPDMPPIMAFPPVFRILFYDSVEGIAVLLQTFTKHLIDKITSIQKTLSISRSI